MPQADDSWSPNNGCRYNNDKACYKGTSASFIFGLGAGDSKPQYNPIQGPGYNARHDSDTARYSSKLPPECCALDPVPVYCRGDGYCHNSTDFMLASTSNWPTWGYFTNPDLSMGYNGAPGNVGGCRTNARGGGTYAGAPDELPSGAQGPPICGSISLGVFGETQLEVWRMATAEELDAVACVTAGHLCWENSECCSGNCRGNDPNNYKCG